MFGREYCNPYKTPQYIIILLTKFHFKKENKDFKQFLFGLNKNPKFRAINLYISPDEIVKIDYKKRLPLQIMDIMLDAMCFRLNEKQQEKQVENSKRDKRAIAK